MLYTCINVLTLFHYKFFCVILQVHNIFHQSFKYIQGEGDFDTKLKGRSSENFKKIPSKGVKIAFCHIFTSEVPIPCELSWFLLSQPLRYDREITTVFLSFGVGETNILAG